MPGACACVVSGMELGQGGLKIRLNRHRAVGGSMQVSAARTTALTEFWQATMPAPHQGREFDAPASLLLASPASLPSDRDAPAAFPRSRSICTRTATYRTTSIRRPRRSKHPDLHTDLSGRTWPNRSGRCRCSHPEFKDFWDLSLEECVAIALLNSKTIRGGSGGAIAKRSDLCRHAGRDRWCSIRSAASSRLMTPPWSNRTPASRSAVCATS